MLLSPSKDLPDPAGPGPLGLQEAAAALGSELEWVRASSPLGGTQSQSGEGVTIGASLVSAAQCFSLVLSMIPEPGEPASALVPTGWTPERPGKRRLSFTERHFPSCSNR